MVSHTVTKFRFPVDQIQRISVMKPYIDIGYRPLYYKRRVRPICESFYINVIPSLYLWIRESNMISLETIYLNFVTVCDTMLLGRWINCKLTYKRTEGMKLFKHFCRSPV